MCLFQFNIIGVILTTLPSQLTICFFYYHYNIRNPLRGRVLDKLDTSSFKYYPCIISIPCDIIVILVISELCIYMSIHTILYLLSQMTCILICIINLHDT